MNLLPPLGRWRNVLQRIRYFQRLFPLTALAKEAWRFPLDYRSDGRPIATVRMVQILITSDCNQRCAMCYVHKEIGKARHLPLERFKEVVDTLRDQRPAFQLLGGEPFLHPDLVAMTAYARQAGCAVQIFSNGTLARPERFLALRDAGLDYLNFSLLGRPASHNAIAGIPRAYDLFFKHLEFAAAQRGNTRIVINFTFTPGKVDEARHAFELAARMGLDGVRLQHAMFLTPSEFAAQNATMQRLFAQIPETQESTRLDTPSGFAEELVAFKTEVSRSSSRIPVQWAPTLDDEEIRLWYGDAGFRTERSCYFPWRGILINADGAVYPCTKIFLQLGKLGEQPLLDIWNTQTMAIFRRNLKQGLYPACSRCCKL